MSSLTRWPLCASPSAARRRSARSRSSPLPARSQPRCSPIDHSDLSLSPFRKPQTSPQPHCCKAAAACGVKAHSLADSIPAQLTACRRVRVAALVGRGRDQPRRRRCLPALPNRDACHRRGGSPTDGGVRGERRQPVPPRETADAAAVGGGRVGGRERVRPAGGDRQRRRRARVAGDVAVMVCTEACFSCALIRSALLCLVRSFGLHPQFSSPVDKSTVGNE